MMGGGDYAYPSTGEVLGVLAALGLHSREREQRLCLAASRLRRYAGVTGQEKAGRV